MRIILSIAHLLVSIWVSVGAWYLVTGNGTTGEWWGIPLVATLLIWVIIAIVLMCMEIVDNW